MLTDEAPTLIRRVPQQRPGAAPGGDVRWVIPSLVAGRSEAEAVEALPDGYRLGEHVVAEARGHDGPCEMMVVTHAERGSLHMARVVRPEHAALAPAMLAAARLIQQHPQRNLLTILETGWTAEATPRAFVVHDRLVGRSLASLLAGRGGIEWPMVLAIGLQCAEALETLHRIGLAHTDLKPESAALVHVSGDQFRVVLGGLDRAQAVEPGACAAEEPRVQADLFALGSMLVALAARSESTGFPVPEALSCMITRMIDPRPAIRPGSAGELQDQLSAVHDQVDPDLSCARMLGEVFRRITSDDFDVSIEADEPRPTVRRVAQVHVHAPAPAPARPRAGVGRWPSLLLVGLVFFGAGAAMRDLQGPSPVAAQRVDSGDDEPDLARFEARRIPELQRGAPIGAPARTLPRCEDQPARGQPSRSLIPRARTPMHSPAAPSLAEEPEVAEVANDEAEGSDLLPIRGASLMAIKLSAAS